jgi:hypothetical protein
MITLTGEGGRKPVALPPLAAANDLTPSKFGYEAGRDDVRKNNL